MIATARRNLPAGLILLACAPAAFAFQPLVTDDTGTQGTGGNQIEASLNEDKQHLSPDVTTTASFPIVFTRGLSDELDLFVQANRTRVHSTATGTTSTGGGNPSFGAKWRFYEDGESGTSLGLKPEIRLPVSAAKEALGLGTGRSSYALTMILTQEAPFGAVHINAATGRDRYRDTAANPDAVTSRLSAAPVWDVCERWKLALDLGRETRDAGGARTRTGFAELGAVYSPDKDLDFAVGLVRRADDAAAKTITKSATLGVTWRFR